jgi:hypothetical protein
LWTATRSLGRPEKPTVFQWFVDRRKFADPDSADMQLNLFDFSEPDAVLLKSDEWSSRAGVQHHAAASRSIGRRPVPYATSPLPIDATIASHCPISVISPASTLSR